MLPGDRKAKGTSKYFTNQPLTACMGGARIAPTTGSASIAYPMLVCRAGLLKPSIDDGFQDRCLASQKGASFHGPAFLPGSCVRDRSHVTTPGVVLQAKPGPGETTGTASEADRRLSEGAHNGGAVNLFHLSERSL
jgi:hypothetical protein